MMAPLFWLCPPAYFAMKAAAEARHAAVGMPADLHERLMQTFYPV